MSKTIQLDIVTPTSIISEGQVEYVRAPSTNGLFGIQSGHASALILMDIGEIKIVKEGKEIFYATNGGFADIKPEGILLLVETAEQISDIDKDRAKSSIKRAKNRLNQNQVDITRAQKSIARARNRIKVYNRFNK